MLTTGFLRKMGSLRFDLVGFRLRNNDNYKPLMRRITKINLIDLYGLGVITKLIKD